jgi:hypothetical protein
VSFRARWNRPSATARRFEKFLRAYSLDAADCGVRHALSRHAESLRRSNRLSRTKQQENGAPRTEIQDWLPKNTVFQLFLSRFLNVFGGPVMDSKSRSCLCIVRDIPSSGRSDRRILANCIDEYRQRLSWALRSEGISAGCKIDLRRALTLRWYT